MSEDANILTLFDAHFAEVCAFLDARPSGESGVDRGDPDVRRIVEAMAYFSARSQSALERGMRSAIERMVSVPVSDLATVLPAAGLVRATPSIDLDGVASLPEGTILRVATASNGSPKLEETSLFSTLFALEIRPIELVSAQVDRSGRAPAAVLKLRASSPQRGAFELAVLVRRMDSYRPSANLFDAIKRSAQRVTVRFDQAASQAVDLSFGVDAQRCSKLVASPLAFARMLLQLPEQDLLLRFALPASDRPWSETEVRIELSERWPSTLTVDRSDFALFVVPMINAWSDPCVPLTFAAKDDALPLRLGVPRAGAELLRVVGVYDADKELRPLIPLALGTQLEGWELLEPSGGPQLRLRVSDPSQLPMKTVVDAHWSQPSLWRSSASASRVTPQRQVAKAQLAPLGLVRRAQQSSLRAQSSWALDVAALRSRASLNRAELVALLQGMGAVGESPFASVVHSLEVDPVRVEIEAVTGSLRRVLTLRWNVVDDESAALARQLELVVGRVVDTLFDQSVVLAQSDNDDSGAGRWA
ncbi:MAG: type VI secretion system baseplate subunit TssF [Deltaproteobacteria bacterium]|nr:type VI secretion system baseplate subunit TssF [Deltaproteobacteria bacterium]